MRRIHVIGAPGVGKSSLARALSERLGVALVEADDLFWAPTDPPYRRSRPAGERAALIAHRLPPDGAWVLSGTQPDRGAAPFAGVTHRVRLSLDAAGRMERLRRRETERFGVRIAAGGDMHATHAAFPAWAEAFDETALDEAAASDDAPCARLDAALPPDALLRAALRELEARR